MSIKLLHRCIKHERIFDFTVNYTLKLIPFYTLLANILQ